MSPASTRSELFSYSLPAALEFAVRRAQKECNSPGYLEIVDRQLQDSFKFTALAAEVREDGFTHVVVLGQDNLAQYAFRKSFGKQPGSPELVVLNSLDPAEIGAVRAGIDPQRTLFIATPDSDLHSRYFFAETAKLTGNGAGHHFLAIAVPGSKLEAVAEELKFRRVYQCERNLDSRYSAFSDAALLPHAAAGYDTEKLLRRGKLALEASNGDDNPGVSLGLILKTAAADFGRGKLTLLCSESIGKLAAWIAGQISSPGLIALEGEPLAEPDNYGNDRIFAYIKYAHDDDSETESRLSALASAGQPVIRIVLENLTDIAQTMVQWEVAATVAGVFETSREATQSASQSGEAPILVQNGLKLFADPANAAAIMRNGESPGGILRHHLDRLKPGDFLSLLAHTPNFPEYEEPLRRVRKQILESKQVATALGFGPCFTNSNEGVYLQITCDDAEDIPLPGCNDTFGTVKAAQACRQFQSLTQQNRRALRVHLGSNTGKSLHQLRNLICAAVEH